MENICFGWLGVLDEEVMKVVKVVGVDEFIFGLVEGYKIEVEERGSVLFVGQCQFIFFVRVLFVDLVIIIFDEVMVSIDIEMEVKIQQVLKMLLKGCIVVMIVYRLFMICDVDCIIVFDYGKKMEEGNYEELFVKGGIYVEFVKV